MRAQAMSRKEKAKFARLLEKVLVRVPVDGTQHYALQDRYARLGTGLGYSSRLEEVRESLKKSPRLPPDMDLYRSSEDLWRHVLLLRESIDLPAEIQDLQKLPSPGYHPLVKILCAMGLTTSASTRRMPGEEGGVKPEAPCSPEYAAAEDRILRYALLSVASPEIARHPLRDAATAKAFGKCLEGCSGVTRVAVPPSSGHAETWVYVYTGALLVLLTPYILRQVHFYAQWTYREPERGLFQRSLSLGQKQPSLPKEEGAGGDGNDQDIWKRIQDTRQQSKALYELLEKRVEKLERDVKRLSQKRQRTRDVTLVR